MALLLLWMRLRSGTEDARSSKKGVRKARRKHSMRDLDVKLSAIELDAKPAERQAAKIAKEVDH